MKPVLLFAIVLLAAFFRLHRIDSLPPGDGYDPAYYGVDALQLLRGEPLPPMLPSNREPLFSTIVAAVFLVLGPSTLGIHLASALVGLATVPAVTFVGEALFTRTDLSDEDRALRRWGALVGALMIAVSYWHLNWSRYGVRAILVPLFAALTFAFLWRGLRSRDRRAFVLCGISLGLSLYTYEAARLLPVLVILGCAAAAWQGRAIARPDWTNMLILGVVALMVFAPLGIYFVRHPDTFTHRMEDVIVTQEAQDATGRLQAILDRTVKAVLSFSIAGDRTPYSTIPGRPSLNPFLSGLFVLGIAVSLARLREPPYLFLLAWLLVMTIPAALAGSGPSAKRAIGALPAVALLIAVGALWPVQALVHVLGFRRERWLKPGGFGGYGNPPYTGFRKKVVRGWTARRSAKWLAAAWTLVVAGGFVYSGVTTYRDYFVRWASNPGLFTHFELGISAIGEYAGGLPRDERIYISPELPMHPSIRFHSGLREDIRGYNGRQCLVLPEETAADTTYIIVPGKDGKSLPLLERYLPQGRVVDRGGYHTGDPYFVAYRVPAGSEAQVTPTRDAQATWGHWMGLLGYDLDRDTYEAGDAIQLALTYQDLKQMEQRYTVFVHLLGSEDSETGSPLWAQDDSEPCRGFYPTSSWHEGEIVIDWLELTVPPDAPSGEYDLNMGFYDVWTGERLPVRESSVPAEHNVVSLGELLVVAGQ